MTIRALGEKMSYVNNHAIRIKNTRGVVIYRGNYITRPTMTDDMEVLEISCNVAADGALCVIVPYVEKCVHNVDIIGFNK